MINMVENNIKCMKCDEEFHATPTQIKRGKKFCSDKCYKAMIRIDKSYHPNYGNRSGSNMNCLNCGNIFYVPKCLKKYDKKFCNRTCYMKYRLNNPETHPNYRGGITLGVCDICGERKKQNKRFCSLDCYNVAKKHERCGIKNTFYGKHHTKKTIREIAKNKQKIFYYGNVRMRSSWEVLFAHFLTLQEIKWKYEPRVFELKTINKHYIPDFYVPEWDTFVEVKGFLWEISNTKIDAFKKEYGNITIVGEKEMKEFGLI